MRARYLFLLGACLALHAGCGSSPSGTGTTGPSTSSAASTGAGASGGHGGSAGQGGGATSGTGGAVATGSGGTGGTGGAFVFPSGSLFVAKTGSDQNPGTMAAPFLTVQKCADVAMPGDTCFLRAGTYHEGPVTPKLSGTAGAPITFTSYPGEHAVVSGADPVSGWTVHSGKIYQAALATKLHEDGAAPALPRTQLFVDGVMVTPARWPNVSGPALMQPETEATAGANTDTTHIHDAALSAFAAGTWNGAVIHLRGGLAWTSETGMVTASTAGELTVDIVADTQPINAVVGSRYYLTNSLAALDTANEAYADGTKAYLWAPAGDDPGAHDVEAKQRDYAFDLSGRSYVVLRGLEVFAASIQTSDSSSHLTLDTLLVKYVSHFVMIGPAGGFSAHTYEESVAADSGIILRGSSNTLENSEIDGSAGNGLSVYGDGHVVTNNLIHDADYDGIYTALIFLGGTNLTITHNTLYETGRDAIHIHPTSGAFAGNEIAFNDIHHWGRLNQDEGGIYGCCLINWTGSSIHHNFFHDLVPTDGRGFYVKYAAHPGAGIYFDNGSDQGLVHHNVTWQTYDSIQLNGMNPDGNPGPSLGMQVYNNSFGPNGGAGAGSTETLRCSDASTSKLINNIFDGGPLFPGGGAFPGVIEANNVAPGTDPKFVDAATFDFHLAAGSPALGHGQVLSVTSTTPPDIGAYEGGNFTPGCSMTGCQ